MKKIVSYQIFSLFLFFLFIVNPVFSNNQLNYIEHERLYSFEDTSVPSVISSLNSKLYVSPTHFKDGSNSLLWEFKPGGEMSIRRDLGFEQKDPTGVDTYLSTFIVWIYNEKAIDDVIQFEFLKDGKKCSSFPFTINFTGWRGAWVCYERDMQGTPEVGMNEIRIVAPTVEGSLYIDHLITATKTDHRHQTPDFQVPFVNPATRSHWLVLLKNWNLKPDSPAKSTISITEKNDLQTIEKRFRDLIYTPSGLPANEINRIEEAYRFYNIQWKDGKISGMPVFFGRAAEAYERLIPDWKDLYSLQGMEVRKFFDLMHRVAVAYNNAKIDSDKEKLKEIFMNMYYHITDQGFVVGSCHGNLTHYGYSFRSLYTSYFLMKDVLRSEEKLEEASGTMRWYGMTNEVYIKPETWGMDMDAFNTVTAGRIASILIMEDTPEKAQYMSYFSRWINNGCLPAAGLAGAFKTDGGAFHHCNNYPAYAVGGLSGATDMIYLMNHTSFAVSELAHTTVKNVLLTMRFYCNKKYYPLSMSGRHPDGRGQLVPTQYARLALAGTPDQSEAIDKEMAEAFLRLMKNDEKSELPEYVPATQSKAEERMIRLFEESSITPENHPEGNFALGYGCVSVQRRDNWSAVARGHSRYLWAAEHYLGANLYGRYLAHGSLQIMKSNNNEEVTPATSGWVQDGFDWGRIPGATAIHLPIEQLKAIVLNVDTCSGFEEMLYSDESFAGGLSHKGQNGNFGMKLHEHDKYNGSHRARKSYHFFEDIIVCLGSSIENVNNNYNTETTVFQLAVTDDAQKKYWNMYREQKNFWIDHLNTGYYTPQKNNLKFEKNFPQHSRKQNTGELTEGDWVSLVVDHGKAPVDQSYEYVVFPSANKERLSSFAKKPTYKVLQQDRSAHIVKDAASGLTSFVFFEKQSKIPSDILQEVDNPCLVMIKDTKNRLSLTVCNPDLALYKGESDEVFDKDGKRIERSIYSRPWRNNPSQVTPVRVTLKGNWIVSENNDIRIIDTNKKQIVIEVLCKDAASYNIELVKK